MMGRDDSSATVGAMHTATGLMSVGLAIALHDGARRAAELREVDRAHQVGMNLVLRARHARRQADLDQAAVIKAKLLIGRAQLHG